MESSLRQRITATFFAAMVVSVSLSSGCSSAHGDTREAQAEAPRSPLKPTVFYLPDAGETRAQLSERFAPLRAAGYGLYAMEHDALQMDAQAIAHASEHAFEELLAVSGLRAQDVVVWGHGIGALGAVELAAEVRPRALVIESAVMEFDAWPRAREALGPLAFMLPAPVSIRDALSRVQTRVLFGHGMADAGASFDDARRMLDAAPFAVGFVRLAAEQPSLLDTQAHRERVWRVLDAERLADASHAHAAHGHGHPHGHHHVGH